MKKIKKILATILTVIFCFNVSITPTYAADFTSSTMSDFPLAGTSEIVTIDGINYKYDYYMENGLRKIDVTNINTNTVEKVAYDPETSTMYLNGSIVSTKPELPIAPYSIGTTADGWEILSKETHKISWGEGISVAALAAMIGAALGFIGGAGVIGAMGMAGLSVIAAGSVGGTVYLELHMYSAPFVQPQYRYMWTFTPSTGEVYGPYYTHV